MTHLVPHDPQLRALLTIEDALLRYSGPDISFAMWLERYGYTGMARHLADIRLSHSAATMPERQSVLAMRSDLMASEHLGGNDHHIEAGYSQIIYHLADGIPIWCDTPVVAIHDEGTHCRILLGDGRMRTARYVVVTAPLTILKAGLIRFEPALSAAKTAAIQAIDMHAALKVVLQFDQPFWPADMSFLTLSDPAPVWWTPRSGSPYLMGLFTGERAQHLRMMPDIVATCVAHITQAFALITPPVLQWSHVEDWLADPWIRGGYSSVPVGAHGHRDALAAAHGRVHFAGEATALDGQSASVHGALSSGWRAAADIKKGLVHDRH